MPVRLHPPARLSLRRALRAGAAPLALVVAAASPAPQGLRAQTDEPVRLSPIVVESESDSTLRQDGYVAQAGRQATKVDTPIRLIPQAVSVVTQDQIEDQAPRTLLEALSYTAGAGVTTFGYDSRYDAYYIRGFAAYYTGMFRDGLRLYNGPSAWFRNEPYTLEGAAVLKGPSSSLYGVSGPGGLVNMVSKRPKDEPFREIEVLAGTDDRYQGAVDLSGPVPGSGTLSYRLTALARTADTSFPAFPDDRLTLAPALTWEITPDTTLTLLGEYTEATVGGTASYYNSSYGVASRIPSADPAWNDFDQTQWRLGWELEHELTDQVVLRQKARYADVDADLQYSGLYDSGAGALARYWGRYAETMSQFTVDTQAQVEIATGPVDHTLLAGIDYTWAEYDAASLVDYASLASIRASALPYAGGQEQNQVGLYLHDQATWRDLTVFLSGRWDHVETTSIAATRAETDATDEALSGRIGVSYDLGNGLAPYANLATSFSPNIGLVYEPVTAAAGAPARPTTALQKEVGIKYAIPGTNSLLSTALFDIAQEDGVVFDASTGVNRQVQRDLRSQGVEFEAVSSFDNGLSLIASWTHLRMKIEKGAAGTAGNELSATPNDVANLWVHYAPPSGALKGFGFGAGLRYVGESWGDDANSFRNDDRVYVDLAVSYDLGRLGIEGAQAQLNVRNLFDATDQTCSAGYCYWDEGLSATLALRHRF
ncbi:TonB-dependent siderophore receptor [Albimonas sp. CAU 1670]|uniref:TonB-dependent siderophore receptor n=1 Tax=Albimonas sp. CAU 1670 TaxID=3032599 RepID=UPI0023DBB241|nr:TonB-dependent siderophore receptor [Albimonas sp. CAU 1670]MDF2235518.1 TonB-dependent siderophore receptor [Albimonas sp. CAU 1670]